MWELITRAIGNVWVQVIHVDNLRSIASEMGSRGPMLSVRQEVSYHGAFEDSGVACQGRSGVERNEESARFQHSENGRYHRRAWFEKQRDWSRLLTAFFENGMGNPVRETVQFIVRDLRRSRLDGELIRKPAHLLVET